MKQRLVIIIMKFRRKFNLSCSEITTEQYLNGVVFFFFQKWWKLWEIATHRLLLIKKTDST